MRQRLRLWLFGCLAVGIACLPRRYEEASSADGGGSGAQVFERSEFLRTPTSASNAVSRRSRATNPARLSLLTFFGEAKKVSALSGANPDLHSNPTYSINKTKTAAIHQRNENAAGFSDNPNYLLSLFSPKAAKPCAG